VNPRTCDLCGHLLSRRQNRVVIEVWTDGMTEVIAAAHKECVQDAEVFELLELGKKLDALRNGG
jgi:hypothetical protein